MKKTKKGVVALRLLTLIYGRYMAGGCERIGREREREGGGSFNGSHPGTHPSSSFSFIPLRPRFYFIYLYRLPSSPLLTPFSSTPHLKVAFFLDYNVLSYTHTHTHTLCLRFYLGISLFLYVQRRMLLIPRALICRSPFA